MRKIVLVLALFFLSEVNADTATYKYDSLGRVVEITYSNGRKIVYEYDQLGNRISMNILNSAN